jgi:hypothetical protein
MMRLYNVPPNGEAQPPAEGDELVKQKSGKHKSGFQKRPCSAGRLERNVGRLGNGLNGYE